MVYFVNSALNYYFSVRSTTADKSKNEGDEIECSVNSEFSIEIEPP